MPSVKKPKMVKKEYQYWFCSNGRRVGCARASTFRVRCGFSVSGSLLFLFCDVRGCHPKVDNRKVGGGEQGVRRWAGGRGISSVSMNGVPDVTSPSSGATKALLS